MSSNLFYSRNAGNVLRVASLIVPLAFSLIFSKTDVPLFLFSGQSNMVGMQNSINDLTADQKKDVENVKIYLDVGHPSVLIEGDPEKSKKWSTLGPGFGNSSTQLGPELFFGRVLFDSMPDTKIALIKVAVSGTYLGTAAGWLPPSANSGIGGTLYENMMAAIDTALEKFNSAFDTTQYTPRWAGFVWLQGEFDAMDAALSNKYEENLTDLIKDIRKKTGVEDLPVILPMIDVQSIWTNNAKVRAADVAVAKKTENCDTMDTKGFPSNGIHYSAAGQAKIGAICAWRWLAMKYLDVPVPVNSVSEKTILLVSSISKNVRSYDLTGRKIVQLTAGVLDNPAKRSIHMIINVNSNKAEKLLQINQR